MKPCYGVFALVIVTAVWAGPSMADEADDSGHGGKGTMAGASPFAGRPLSASELKTTSALGWQISAPAPAGRGASELGVILWDEAVPPRSQRPAPRPGQRTEFRQGGRLVFTATASSR